MFNFDNYTNESKIEYDLKWPYNPDHPYRIFFIGRSGSGKTNALLNLIKDQPDIDKIYLYAKDPYEVKYLILHTFFIMKIPNKRELQQTALNHSSDIDFKDFMKIYKKCTAKPYYFLVIDTKPYYFLVIDTTLPSDNPLKLRKNLLE